MRSVAERTGVTLNVLIFTANAARINAFFERMHPDLKLRMIPFELGSIRWVFDLKAAIDRGELVALMGDRVWESERDREVAVTFLGRRARFPKMPALILQVPRLAYYARLTLEVLETRAPRGSGTYRSNPRWREIFEPPGNSIVRPP